MEVAYKDKGWLKSCSITEKPTPTSVRTHELAVLSYPELCCIAVSFIVGMAIAILNSSGCDHLQESHSIQLGPLIPFPEAS